MTIRGGFSLIIVSKFKRWILNSIKLISLNIKKASPEDIGKLYLEEESLAAQLTLLKNTLGLEELMYLATCNRTEFLIRTSSSVDAQYLKYFLLTFKPGMRPDEATRLLEKMDIYTGMDACTHLTNVAASMDSLVVGEREIITQVRNAYERCRAWGLTGDLTRLLVSHSIVAAKKVYAETDIAKHAVSVVSLAYRKLRDLNVDLHARILLIGAGQTNASMAKYLKKHGFNNLAVFNRTLYKAQALAKELGGQAFEMRELADKGVGFDVIITCTGAEDYIITENIYAKMLNGDKRRKLVIDLAIPADFDPGISKNSNINLIAISNLKNIADRNMEQRKGELERCNAIIADSVKDFQQIFNERQVELAMSAVPGKIREIVDRALHSVYASDVDKMDTSSKETLDKVLTYVERKYISVPMKMAREVLLSRSGY